MPIPPPELPPYSHSDLIDALPTIFVGFGVAFAVGVLTGAIYRAKLQIEGSLQL